MVKGIVLSLALATVVWAPWMDRQDAVDAALSVVSDFGWQLEKCREGSATSTDGTLSWYPFGRMVHTCAGDVTVMFWGSVDPLASAQLNIDIGEPLPAQLTCAQILNTIDERMSTSSSAVEPLYTGTTTAVDLASWPGVQGAKKELGSGMERGPVYAGRYALAEWACGAQCTTHAVIDVGTGRIVAGNLMSEYGLEYHIDSNILVTNPAKNVSLPEDDGVAISALLSLARTSREYYRVGIDEISGLPALTKVCVENAAIGVASLTP